MAVTSSSSSSSAAALRGASQKEQEGWDVYKKLMDRRKKLEDEGKLVKREYVPSKLLEYADEDVAMGIGDWKTFSTKMRRAKEIQEDVSDFLKKTLQDKSKSTAPFARQKTGDWETLASLVGQKNYNIRYQPQFISEPSAQAYIDANLAKAKGKEKERWAKWAVAQADLDDNPATPDNVIVFSDKRTGKIRAIDGYALGTVDKKGQNVYKNAIRNLYAGFPTAVDRQALSAQARKHLKSYYKKYPTLREQEAHPIEQFDYAAEESAFNNIRALVKTYLEAWGLGVRKLVKAGTTIERGGVDIEVKADTVVGQLTAPHFMKLLARLTSMIYKLYVAYVFEFDVETYDWKADPRKLKSAGPRKILAARSKNPGDKGSEPDRFITGLHNNRHMRRYISNLIAQINDEEGGKPSAMVIVLQPDMLKDPLIPNHNNYHVLDKKLDIVRTKVGKYENEEEVFVRVKGPVTRAKQPRYLAYRTGQPIVESSMEEARAQSKKTAGGLIKIGRGAEFEENVESDEEGNVGGEGEVGSKND
jgi:hypothetical protein